jgi:hypothetical protein
MGEYMDVRSKLWSCDFLLVPVLTMMGIKHFHVFVFIQYCTRQIKIVGVREKPDGAWTEQIAKNITCNYDPTMSNCKYLIHDRDTLYTMKFEQTLKDFGITTIKTPPRSPNLNPYAERVIRSIKEECLSSVIFFGQNNLRKYLKQYVEHYHLERNHQGIKNQIIESENETLSHSKKGQGEIIKKERIGGLLNYYYRKSA